MNNSNIGYTQNVQREIKKAITRLKKTGKNSERIGTGNNNSLDLWITPFNSDLGKDICEKGKKLAKKHLPFFTAKKILFFPHF